MLLVHNDPHVINSTGALTLGEIAKRVLIVGGGMVGIRRYDMVGEIALAIEVGEDAVDICKTIPPHLTSEESMGMTHFVLESTNLLWL